MEDNINNNKEYTNRIKQELECTMYNLKKFSNEYNYNYSNTLIDFSILLEDRIRKLI